MRGKKRNYALKCGAVTICRWESGRLTIHRSKTYVKLVTADQEEICLITQMKPNPVLTNIRVCKRTKIEGRGMAILESRLS